MNPDYRDTFNNLKPVCDILMMNTTPDNLSTYTARVSELKKELIQVFQQYLTFPLISRLKCPEVRRKVDIHLKVLEAVQLVLERIVSVNSFEMFLKLETALMTIIFDAKTPGMVSNASEEVKYSTVKCLTLLMSKIPHSFRERLLKKHVPMLAQVVFVTVHIAKLEKLRVLRLEALYCVMAHTMTHCDLTKEYRIPNQALELMIVDNLLSSILPGLLAALQDVATSTDNPGHAVVVAAVEAIHRILCLPMHDKYLPKKTLTTEDFVKLVNEKSCKDMTEVSKEKNPKDMAKRSEEWFAMAGDKLTLITKSIVALRTHEHYLVRKELCVFCYRLITECGKTMPASVPLCLDVLISLSKDEYHEVAYYCNIAVSHYFDIINEETKHIAIDCMMDNFMELLKTLPRILNNIDSNQKLSALNLLVGYIERLANEEHLSPEIAQQLVSALATAAEHDTSVVKLTRVANRDVLSPPPLDTPWSVLRHVDSPQCVTSLRAACAALARSAAAHTVLDLILEAVAQDTNCGLLYVMNCMIEAPNVPSDVVKRILDAYLEDEAWAGPIETETNETLDAGETVDITVYNPLEWTTDRVPGLYSGAVHSRSRDIPLCAPRVSHGTHGSHGSLRARVVRRALLAAGAGRAALPLQHNYYTYLMRTLCPLLQDVGNEFELIHLAGLRALHDVSAASGHACVADLIRNNADYFTNQITVKLKKAWDCKSALEILSVVMEYSDATMLDCLYGIVEDVLVQSCDKYYEKYLTSYLQVFLTFIECIRRWFPVEIVTVAIQTEQETDLLHEVNEYVKYTQEAERLLSDSEFERYTGKSAEEMYKEDLKKRLDEEMDYDDRVTDKKSPPPLHVKVTITILKRVVNFITSQNRDCAIYSLQILNRGLPILIDHEDELLPLVHACWTPLVSRFTRREAIVLRRAFDLLVTIGTLSKEFITSRTIKDVLPQMCLYLHESCKESRLKDAGSAYRNSAAFRLQERALRALPALTTQLAITDTTLEEVMQCVDCYLSKKQPKPLQEAAVIFFKTMLEYDYAATWYHLRKLCDNNLTLEAPTLKYLRIEPIEGTPYWPKDKDYENNIKLIFDIDKE